MAFWFTFTHVIIKIKYNKFKANFYYSQSLYLFCYSLLVRLDFYEWTSKTRNVVEKNNQSMRPQNLGEILKYFILEYSMSKLKFGWSEC